METATITIDKDEARELWRKYKEHQHYSTPLDDEIRRTYQLIAQGRVVIQAIQSIVAAGVNAEGVPNLALVRADAPECFWFPTRGGGVFRSHNGWGRRNEAKRNYIVVPEGTWPTASGRWRYGAQVPLVPLHLRPKRGMANYHILWEAEWTKVVPVDPMLLRRIGDADLWLVLAAWDLTEVERAALAARLNG